MSRLARPRRGLWIAVLLGPLLACASARPRAGAPGEAAGGRALGQTTLEPATPGVRDPPAQGRTGETNRIVVGTHRRAVLALFRQYVDAVLRRDAGALGGLFADPVSGLSAGTTPERRERFVAFHEQVLSHVDTTQLSALLRGDAPAVLSASDLARRGESRPGTMLADDWILDLPPRFAEMRLRLPANASAYVARRFVVRFTADGPAIVAIDDAALRARP